MKAMKKFDVLEMKMVTNCKNKNKEKKDFSLIGVNYPCSSKDNVKIT